MNETLETNIIPISDNNNLINSNNNSKQTISDLQLKLIEKCDEIDRLNNKINEIIQKQQENDFHTYQSLGLSDIQLHNKINSWLKKTGLHRKLHHSNNNTLNGDINSNHLSSRPTSTTKETTTTNDILTTKTLNNEIDSNDYNFDGSRMNEFDYTFESLENDSTNYISDVSPNESNEWHSNMEDIDEDNEDNDDNDEDSIGINYSGRYISAADLYLIVLQDLIALRMELAGTSRS